MDSKKTVLCWEKRTKLEKFLITTIIVTLPFVLYLIVRIQQKAVEQQDKNNICTTSNCIQSLATILSRIDPAVNPCDDFYKFACGNFLKTAQIPDEKGGISGFSQLSDDVVVQLRDIYEEPIKGDDIRPLKLMKMSYQSCMNTTQIEKDSLDYFRRLYKKLGGWPVLQGTNWNERNFDWKKLLYNMRKLGLKRNLFFTIYIDTDYKDSTKHTLTIAQPCFSYKWFKKGFNSTYVKALYEFMVETVTILGAERVRALGEMRELIDFAIKLSNIIIPHEERKNASLEYNPMTIRQLQQEFSSIPWLQFINVYLSPIEMMISDEIVIVESPKFLGELEDLLLKTPKRILANYMFWYSTPLRFFPEVVRKKQLEFEKVAYGNTAQRPRWKECVTSQSFSFSIATSYVYIKRYFNEDKRDKVKELVEDIQDAFRDRLRSLDWMDETTKRNALLKLDRMRSYIGYPNRLLYENIEHYYNNLELDLNEFPLELALNISNFAHMHYVKRLREPVEKHSWKDQSYSYIVNAFYSRTDNMIELPAAVLQGNFYNPNRPNYMNYATIGEIIGHEITHGFDDIGRQFDHVGNLIDWWLPVTNRTFSQKANCFVQQYNKYYLHEIEMNLNGLMNLGENIADNGGIKIAYQGYGKWLERNSIEMILPGLNFTPRQLFWISAATTWCSKYTKASLKNLVLNGHHAPDYYRVIVPYMNSEDFAEDFQCPLGSNMNPVSKCKIW